MAVMGDVADGWTGMSPSISAPRRGGAPRRRWAAAWLLAGLLGASCDAGMLSAPPPAACAAIGSHCQLPDGPLGVCQAVACAAGTPAPCFTCTAQH
jgi:hypothetical protein